MHGADILSLTTEDEEVLSECLLLKVVVNLLKKYLLKWICMQLILEHNADKMQAEVTDNEEMCTCELESIQLVNQERSITIGLKKFTKLTWKRLKHN